MPIISSSGLRTKVLRNNGLLNCFIKYQKGLVSSFCNYQDQANTFTETIPKEDPKVIIIGAGVSGLSAADHLIHNGFKNIEILEASNRFGGRIYTRKFGDAICELGAKCIIKNNASKSIYDFIKNDYDYKELKKIDEKVILTSNGEKLNPIIISKATKAFNTLLKNSSFLKNTVLIDSFNNSKVYLEKETEILAKTLFKKDSQEASQIFNTLINDYCSFFGCDLSKIHVYQLSKTSPFYNNQITINNGMYTVLKPLLTDIDNDQIIYTKPVSKIEWSKLELLQNIKITCLDNTEYIADHVLCTLPLGTLKTFHSILFEPQLSLDKIGAIENIGVTSPGQFYLKYNDDVNKWFVGSIKPAWSSTELGNRTNISRDIVEISTIPNSKHVLEFKRIGDEDFERLNETTIIKDTTKFLRKLLNNTNIPYPNDIIRSNWGTDTKFLGGLPVIMRANSEKFVENLSSPCYSYQVNDNNEIPKILFAGDATDWDGFGTLDGARSSGIREAQRILDFYKYRNRQF